MDIFELVESLAQDNQQQHIELSDSSDEDEPSGYVPAPNRAWDDRGRPGTSGGLGPPSAPPRKSSISTGMSGDAFVQKFVNFGQPDNFFGSGAPMKPDKGRGTSPNPPRKSSTQSDTLTVHDPSSRSRAGSATTARSEVIPFPDGSKVVITAYMDDEARKKGTGGSVVDYAITPIKEEKEKKKGGFNFFRKKSATPEMSATSVPTLQQVPVRGSSAAAMRKPSAAKEDGDQGVITYVPDGLRPGTADGYAVHLAGVSSGSGRERLYFIRIFRRDGTFATVNCPLTTSAAELCHILGKKFFMPDISKFVIYLVQRVMGPQEKPLFLQKRWLEQAGYTEEDNLQEIGREDNSYLFKFVFAEIRPPPAIKLPKESEMAPGQKMQHFDLQARNLPTIPKILYRYTSSILTLNLSQNHSLEVPAEFMCECKSLRELRLSNNDYNQVPAAVAQLLTLNHLDLSQNRLRELDHAHLHNITSLLTIKLQSNRLTDLPLDFSRFQNLTTLYLSNNRFEQFPKVICEMTSLLDLDLSFNKITQIPEDIGKLTRLERLLLIGNRLAGSLPHTFKQLVELKELDLRQNQIQDLGVLGDMSSLVLLFIDYNAVSTLTCQFRSLQHLTLTKNKLTQFKTSSIPTTSMTYLNLSKSQLPGLPDNLFDSFPMLDRLVLDDNQLVAVPTSICRLKHLSVLSMTDNMIADIMPDIHKLEWLSQLDVHNNNLRKLPPEIWQCQSLVSLNVSSNLLTVFPDPPEGSQPPIPIPKQGASKLMMVGDARGMVQPQQSKNGKPNNVPPLSIALRHLFLGDNRLTDDIFSQLAFFTELRTLNISYNDIYEIPRNGFYNLTNLVLMFMSGNQITSLPGEEIGRLRNLKELFLNGNKLHTLPAELGKIVKLKVLDVGNNSLKYNIANWPYDWNWNWNLELKHLNLSGNKKLEIKVNRHENMMHNRNLSDFSSLTGLRILGLMDVTLMVAVPDETHDKRVRLSACEINTMRYGMADTLGRSDSLCNWDMAIPRFRGQDSECLLALFDGRIGSKFGGAGSKVTKYLSDWLNYTFSSELSKLKDPTKVEDAIRRTFLGLNKELGAIGMEDTKTGASAVMVYVSGTTLYAANVGDALAVISSEGGNAVPLSDKHTPWIPDEIQRIQGSGGFVSHQGLLNGELGVSRSFGHFHLLPTVNASPHIKKIELTEDDEFIILASKGLWDRMSHQTAVDIARTERNDLMVASAKLRDFAVTYGADDSIMVMMLGVGDLFDRRRKQKGRLPAHVARPLYGHQALNEDALNELRKNRRGKDKNLGDSELARLEKEVDAPKGNVALVFTDIKNSTYLWETLPKAMQAGIKIHNKIMRRFLRSIGGYEVKTEGDAFMVAFPAVSSALLWCLTCQLQLLKVDWPEEILNCDDGKEIHWLDGEKELLFRGLSVRMGIHYGAPVCETDPVSNRMDYFGPMVNKSARISGVADGGQISVSQDVINEVNALDELLEMPEDELDSMQLKQRKEAAALKKLGFQFVSIGDINLKGFENPEPISLVYPSALVKRFDFVQMKKKAKKDADRGEREVQLIEPSDVRQLGHVALRLERVTSGHVINDVEAHRKSHLDYLGSLLTLHVKENAKDSELLKVLDNLISRIENAANSIRLQRIEPYLDVIEKASRQCEEDPERVFKALALLSKMEREGKSV